VPRSRPVAIKPRSLVPSRRVSSNVFGASPGRRNPELPLSPKRPKTTSGSDAIRAFPRARGPLDASSWRRQCLGVVESPGSVRAAATDTPRLRRRSESDDDEDDDDGCDARDEVSVGARVRTRAETRGAEGHPSARVWDETASEMETGSDEIMSAATATSSSSSSSSSSHAGASLTSFSSRPPARGEVDSDESGRLDGDVGAGTGAGSESMGGVRGLVASPGIRVVPTWVQFACALLASPCDPRRTLVAFDVDETLVHSRYEHPTAAAASTDPGALPEFRWLRKLGEGVDAAEQKRRTEAFHVAYRSALHEKVLAEQIVPDVLRELRKRGFVLFGLTARSYQHQRDVTLRSLAALRIDFGPGPFSSR